MPDTRRVFVAVPGAEIHIRCAMRGEPDAGGFIGRDQADLRAEFGTHIRQRHALGHRQCAHRLAAEFNRLVLAAVQAMPADHQQHHVLGADAVAQAAGPAHENRLRHTQPDLAGDDNTKHLGRTDAKHVGAKSTAGGRMRITANAEHARPDMPGLRHHHMADAQAVVDMRQGLLGGPFTRDAHDAARLFVDRRHIVVEHEHDLVFVPDFRAQLGQHRLQSTRAAGVVEHRQVDPASHDLTRLHHRAASRLCNKFLRQRGGLLSGLCGDHHSPR